MKKIILTALLSSLILACTSSDLAEQENIVKHDASIKYGVPDTRPEHNAVIALYVKGNTDTCVKSNMFFCSGTLIDEQHVITAAHCVDSELMKSCPTQLYIGVGNNEKELSRQLFKVESFMAHNRFSYYEIESNYDIAVIRLENKVPAHVATPIPLIPLELAPNQDHLDNNVEIVEHVGFGLTEKLSAGTKMSLKQVIQGYCGKQNLNSEANKMCSFPNVNVWDDCVMGEVIVDGFIRHDYVCSTSRVQDVDYAYASYFMLEAEGGTCSGDSGGPMFVTRNNKQYLAGITAHGAISCMSYGVSTSIVDHLDWIEAAIADLDKAEDCTNNIDDDYDGKIDCQDNECWQDPACVGVEICDNLIDDDHNGLADCADPQCETAANCIPEVEKLEICNNNIDDDGDTLADCDDFDCRDEAHCASVATEICDNNIDDNADTLVDCDDPSCKAEPYCKSAATEICDNNIDDDGDTLVDCDDSNCLMNEACTQYITNLDYDNTSSCSFTMLHSKRTMPIWLLILSALYILILPRKRWKPLA
ncbi:MAG: trypsin-like serine protease [Bradymonadales bacterium]